MTIRTNRDQREGNNRRRGRKNRLHRAVSFGLAGVLLAVFLWPAWTLKADAGELEGADPGSVSENAAAGESGEDLSDNSVQQGVGGGELPDNSVQPGEDGAAGGSVSGNGVSGNQLTKMITDLHALDSSVEKQYIPVESSLEAVVFPEALKGEVDGQPADIPVKEWTMTQSNTEGIFDTSAAGNWFIYTPAFPEEYRLAQGVYAEWCNILVTVGSENELERLAQIDSLYQGADTSWYDGHEQNEKFYIENAAQLLGLSKISNTYQPEVDFRGKIIHLNGNIALSSFRNGWIPISSHPSRDFQGRFEGNGHTISNMVSYNAVCSYEEKTNSMGTSIEPVYYNNFGIFGILGRSAYVTDLTVGKQNSSEVIFNPTDHSASTNTGAIAGYNSGTINACFNQMDLGVIPLGDEGASSCLGGIAGINWGRILNCGNLGNVSFGDYAGGIAGSTVGIPEGADIENCYNRGDCNRGYYNGNKGPGCNGGIAGVSAGSRIRNCYSTGRAWEVDYTGSVVGLTYFSDPNRIESAYWLNRNDTEGIPGWGAMRIDVGSFSSHTSETDPLKANRMNEGEMKTNNGLLARLNSYAEANGGGAYRLWTLSPSLNDGYPVFTTQIAGGGGTSGSLTGTITFAGGGPAQDIDVILTDTSGAWLQTAVTGADGAYDFAGLAAGTYRVWASAKDRSRGNVSGWVTIAGGRTVVDLGLYPPILTGQLKDFAGIGTGGTVLVTDSSGRQVGAGMTLADGSYYVYGSAGDGSYRVEVTKDGVTVGNGSVTLGGGRPPVWNMGSVGGVVTDGAGAPLPGVTVTLTGSDGKTYTGYTGADGSYVIGGVPDGDYSVSFSKGNSAGNTVILGNGSVHVSGGGLTPTGGSIEGGGGTIRVPGASQGIISGAVLYQNGGAAAGAVVTVSGGHGVVGSAVIGGNGAFLIGGLADGSYTVTVERPDGGLVTGTVVISGKSLSLTGGDMELKDGRLSIMLDKNPSVVRAEESIKVLPDPSSAQDSQIEAAKEQIARVKEEYDALTAGQRDQLDPILSGKLDQLIGRLDGINLKVDGSQSGTDVDGSGLGLMVDPDEIVDSGAGDTVVDVTLTVNKSPDGAAAGQAAADLAAQDGRVTGEVYDVTVDKQVNQDPAPVSGDSKVTVVITIPDSMLGGEDYQVILISRDGIAGYTQTRQEGGSLIFRAGSGDQFVISCRIRGGDTGDGGGSDSGGSGGSSGNTQGGGQSQAAGGGAGTPSGNLAAVSALPLSAAEGMQSGAPGVLGPLDDTPKTSDPAPVYPVLVLGLGALALAWVMRGDGGRPGLMTEQEKDAMVRSALKRAGKTAFGRYLALARIAVILFLYHLMKEKPGLSERRAA